MNVSLTVNLLSLVNAIKELRVLLAGHTVTTEWVPREEIFAIFGH